MLTTSFALSEEAGAGASTEPVAPKAFAKADQISFFEVPFRCEAAPNIGCGSISKPVLLALEREPTIIEAWLNGTGTVLRWLGLRVQTENRDPKSQNRSWQRMAQQVTS
jgi:hypothetical protein